MPGDDQAEYSGGNIIARLGTGATATSGGDLSVNSYSSITFQLSIPNESYAIVRITASCIGNTLQSQGSTTPQTFYKNLIINTLCLNPSLYCDQEGAINATCDGSSGTALCSCPGNYSQVNKTCQCK
jgi:hypothetical protein